MTNLTKNILNNTISDGSDYKISSTVARKSKIVSLEQISSLLKEVVSRSATQTTIVSSNTFVSN